MARRAADAAAAGELACRIGRAVEDGGDLAKEPMRPPNHAESRIPPSR
jgi:hypothetical protein